MAGFGGVILWEGFHLSTMTGGSLLGKESQGPMSRSLVFSVRHRGKRRERADNGPVAIAVNWKRNYQSRLRRCRKRLVHRMLTGSRRTPPVPSWTCSCHVAKNYVKLEKDDLINNHVTGL